MAPGARREATQKTHLRTYSRRSLKRRHTSPPRQKMERSLARTWSLDVAEPRAAERRSELQDQQPLQPTPIKGRKSVRFSLAPAEKKTPNDLAWEALSSSEPVLTGHDDVTSSELDGSHETRVIKCSPGHQGSEDQQPAVGDELNGPSEERPRGDAGSKADALVNVSLEESEDLEDGSSEIDRDGEANTTALTSSPEGDGGFIPTSSESQRTRIGGRFLFDRSPPKGFKVLLKPQDSQKTDQQRVKKRQKLTDGFTKDEARSVFLGKRRRLQHLDVNVGSLDLTQTSGASQQRRREISPEEKRLPRSRTTVLAGRQYFSASQFKADFEGPEGLSEMNKEQTKGREIESDRNRKLMSLADNFCPIFIPRTDSPRPESTGRLGLSSHSPGDLVKDLSPIMHLPPKRSMDVRIGNLGSLTLRPGPPSRMKPALFVPDTPLQEDSPRW